MTEEQMRDRIKEIDVKLNALRSERREYESSLMSQKRQRALEEHRLHIGKCYVSKEMLGNKQQYVRAFKILDVLDSPNENYAVCAALIDGLRNSDWKELGLQIMTLNVWSYNERRAIHDESDLKVIDFYEEVSPENFEQMCKEFLNDLYAHLNPNCFSRKGE